MIPSNPADVTAANTRYGLDEGSGALNSSLFRYEYPFPLRCFGTLTIAERFPELHAMYAGASYPGTSLWYELVVGLQIADNALA